MSKRKWVSIRKPKLRITVKGIRMTRPTARIGGKTGVNLSSKGVSASVRTSLGTVSTRKGRSTLFKPRKKKGCALLTLLPLLALAALIGSSLGVLSLVNAALLTRMLRRAE